MKYCKTCNGVIPQGHGRNSKASYCCRKCYDMRNYPQRCEIVEHLNRNNNITATAQLFGVNKQALYRWMEHYSIRRKTVFV